MSEPCCVLVVSSHEVAAELAELEREVAAMLASGQVEELEVRGAMHRLTHMAGGLVNTGFDSW